MSTNIQLLLLTCFDCSSGRNFAPLRNSVETRSSWNAGDHVRKRTSITLALFVKLPLISPLPLKSTKLNLSNLRDELGDSPYFWYAPPHSRLHVSSHSRLHVSLHSRLHISKLGLHVSPNSFLHILSSFHSSLPLDSTQLSSIIYS